MEIHWVRAAIAAIAVLGLFSQVGAQDRVPTRADVRLGMPAVADPQRGHPSTAVQHPAGEVDYWSSVFVFALSTFIGLGVITRVSRLLHTPLMSLTNAISAIAVVGALLVAGPDYPAPIRFLGAVALFASMTNIVSGFLLTDRMLKMFKQAPREKVQR